jgi:hypothetical protein
MPLAFVIPPGKSGLRFVGVLLLLHVKIDGTEVHPDAQGDVIVQPGLRHWQIFAPDGVTLLASGDIFCPECSPRNQPLPPTSTETPEPPQNPIVLMAAVMVIFAATFVLLCAFPRRR